MVSRISAVLISTLKLKYHAAEAGRIPYLANEFFVDLLRRLVLPNPWDVGTALYLRKLGFKALATTSSGFAFSRGLPDEVWAIPLDSMLAHIRDVASATPLPVNADFQTGYADEPEDVAGNVALCIATGIAVP